MGKLKPLICTQCGGTINRATYICEYCGTKYKEDWISPVPIKISPLGTHVLCSQAIMDDDMIRCMGSKNASEFVLHRMAEEIAQQLIPMMDVCIERTPEDLMRNSMTVRAKLRVLDPTFRF